METRSRSIVKAVTYRAGGLAVTFLVAWVLTRRSDLALGLGVADRSAKIFAFYAHERLWQEVRYGCTRSPEYDI